MAYGKIITISGVSGCGKSFVKRQFLEKRADCNKLITVTTRKRRKYEKNGIDKLFFSEGSFKRQVGNNKLFGIRRLADGTCYAFRKQDLKVLNKGINLIAEVPYDSVKNFRKKHKNVVSIYVVSGDIEQTVKKLRKRSLEEEEIKEKVASIGNEMDYLKENGALFDYIIVNNYDDSFVDIVNKCISSIFKK